MKKCFTLTLLVCSLYACAQTPNDVIAKKCDSMFGSYGEKPGVAVLIVQDGKIAFEKGYGLANLEYNIPITPTTVFDIASLSKQLTGYAISTLIQQDKISPGDDIHQYLPDLPDFGKKITIRNLIHHTSGLRDWPEVLHYAGWRWDEAFRWDDIMRMVKLQKELDFEPGSQYQYSNTGYSLLAAIVEKVTGKTLPVWLDEHIFQPLHMNSTQVLTDYSKIIKNLATSYHFDKDGFHNSSDMLTGWGSSSTFTTAEDLSKWVIAFAKGLEDKDPVYTRMIETDTLNNGGKNNYAYGNQVKDDQGLLNINHTGGWAGFLTVISTYPAQKISIILLSNNGSFSPAGNANNVARALFAGKFKTEKDPGQIDWASKPTLKVGNDILQKYANTYRIADGWYVTFMLEDGKLMAQMAGLGKFPTETKSDSVIWVPEYKSAFIFRDITGKANSAKFRNFVAQKITPIKPAADRFGQYSGDYYSPELETAYRVYVDAGKLMMHHMRLGEFEMVQDMGMADVFNSSGCRVRFNKDMQGKITGFSLSGSRVRNIRFNKQ